MPYRTHSHFPRLLAIFSLCFSLLGCFGTGDTLDTSVAGTPIPPPTSGGKFLDGPVTGASYDTSGGLSGLTLDGDYSYLTSGDMVTFSVGGIILGTLEGSNFVTPVELTGSEALGTASQAAINMMVFLQSIDEDQNPLNGIFITQATRDAAQTSTLNFDSPSFPTDVAAVVAAITPPPGNAVVSEAEALDNFYVTYTALGGSDTITWPFPQKAPFPRNDAPATLANGNFESPSQLGPFYDPIGCSGTVIPGTNWSCAGDSESYLINDSDTIAGPGNPTLPNLWFTAPISHPLAGAGVQSLLQRGNSAVTQTIPLFAEDSVDLSAEVMNWVLFVGLPDFFAGLGNNQVYLEIEFWDAPGGLGNSLGADTSIVYDSSLLPVVAGTTGDSDWTNITLNAVAPAGTQSATIKLVHVDVGGDGGYGVWDDVSMTVTQAPAPELFALIWEDEFDGPALDRNNWYIEEGYGPNGDGWGNQEWQLYTASTDNIDVIADAACEDGHCLRITALCPVDDGNPANGAECGVRNGTVTSGKINTLMSDDPFTFRYGKVQARIKMPVEKGAWPAFWMLGKNFPDVGWPNTGEIDITEVFTVFGSNGNTTHTTLHWCDQSLSLAITGNDPSCPNVADGNFIAGYDTITSSRALPVSLGDDFHIYEIEWNAREIIGRIDGLEVATFPINPVLMDEFQREFYLILNVAMGGTLGSERQPPDGSEVFPQEMLVDWVRVFQGGPIILPEQAGLKDGSFEPPGVGDSTSSLIGRFEFPTDGGAWQVANQFPQIVADDGVNGTPAFNVVGPVARDGNQSLLLEGFDNIVEQFIPVDPFTTVTLAGWALNWETRPLEVFGLVELRFLDESGAFLDVITKLFFPVVSGDAIVLPLQDGNDPDDWTEFSISSAVPFGAVQAQLFLLHGAFCKPAENPGCTPDPSSSIFFDNFNWTVE